MTRFSDRTARQLFDREALGSDTFINSLSRPLYGDPRLQSADPFAVSPEDDPPTNDNLSLGRETLLNRKVHHEHLKSLILYHKVHVDPYTNAWYLTARYREHVLHIEVLLPRLMHPSPSNHLAYIIQATQQGLSIDSTMLNKAAQATLYAVSLDISAFVPKPPDGPRTLEHYMAAKHVWTYVFADKNGLIRITDMFPNNVGPLQAEYFPEEAQISRSVAVYPGKVPGIEEVPHVQLSDFEVVDDRDAFTRQTIVVRKRGTRGPLLIFKPAHGTLLYLEALRMHIAVYNQLRKQPDNALRRFPALRAVIRDQNNLVHGHFVEAMAGMTPLTALTELPSVEQRIAWYDDIVDASLQLSSIGWMWGMPRPEGVLVDSKGQVRLRGMHGPESRYTPGLGEIRDILGINWANDGEAESVWGKWPLEPLAYPQV